jgi:hypothetical protein
MRTRTANCLVEAERARINRKIVAALDVQATKSDAVSVSCKGVEGPLALAPVLGMRMGVLPTLPWLPDTAASACMLCATTFSVTKRVRFLLLGFSLRVVSFLCVIPTSV